MSTGQPRKKIDWEELRRARERCLRITAELRETRRLRTIGSMPLGDDGSSGDPEDALPVDPAFPIRAQR